MIRGKIFGDDRTVTVLFNVSERVKDALRNTIGRNALRLRRKVMQEKLTGQALKVRTGTLRRSIDSTVLNTSDSSVGVVGTNVIYGRVHEYGFAGTSIKGDLQKRKKAWKGALKNPALAHVAPVQGSSTLLPARSFLRSALAEMGEDFIKDVDETVRKALNE